MTFRVLITGARTWTDKAAIATALADALSVHGSHLFTTDGHGPRVAWDRVTVVHGAARGADTIAGRLAAAWGMRVEAHPVTDVDWRAPCVSTCKPGHRKVGRGGVGYCPSAAHRRNQRMVDLGADVCLAFPLGASRGTRDCMRRAEAARIRVYVYDPRGQPTTSVGQRCR